MTTEIVTSQELGLSQPQAQQNIYSPTSHALAAAAAANEEASIKAQLVLALEHPRDLNVAWLEVDRSCRRPGLAVIAKYRVKFGGKEQSGPSVHLARALAQCLGHFKCSSQFVADAGSHFVYRCTAIDLSASNSHSVDVIVPKTVQRKRGGRTEDIPAKPHEIRQNVSRETAYGIRNCILHLIPRDITEKALEVCDETRVLSEQGRLEKDRDSVVRDLLVAFDNLEEPATKEMLEEYLGHDIEQVTAQEVARLREIFRAIKEGASSRDEFFVLGAAEESITDAAKELGIAVPIEQGKEALFDEPAAEKPQTRTPKWATGTQTKLIKAAVKSNELSEEELLMFRAGHNIEPNAKMPFEAARLLLQLLESGEIHALGSTLDPGMS